MVDTTFKEVLSAYLVSGMNFYYLMIVLLTFFDSGFWRMRDKIGLPLEDIHIQGHVPQCTVYLLLFILCDLNTATREKTKQDYTTVWTDISNACP